MIDGQSQSNAGKRPCPARVSINYGLSIEFGTVGIRNSQNYDDVLPSVLLGNLLNTLLTFQVKCSSCGSDKALGLSQHRFGTGAPDTGLNSWTLYSIPLAENNDFLSFQFHVSILLEL